MNFTTKTKKITLALALVLALSSAHADSSYMTYQGVAFDNGTAKASTNISLRFTIYQSDGTTIVYQETKSSVATTDKGFFSHQIGSGTAVVGTYPNIALADDYKLKVEVDYANGTAYTDLGTNDLTSSFYAKKLDGVTATAAELNKLSGVTATTAQLNHVAGVTSPIQTQLNAKLATSGNAATATTATTATTLATARAINGTSFNGSADITVHVNTTQTTGNGNFPVPFVGSVTAGNKILYTDDATTFSYNPSTNAVSATTFIGALNGNANTASTAGTLTGLTSTVTELNYVDGVTSNIQTQLDAKKIYFTSGVGTLGITAGTNYALFPSTRDTLSLSVGTYEVEIGVYVAVTGSTVSGALRLNPRGSGSATGTIFGLSTGTILQTSTPLQTGFGHTTLGNTMQVTDNSTSSSRIYTASFKGIMNITVAGTIIPAYTFSSTLTGGTVTLPDLNYMKIKRIADTSVTTFGGWN